MYQMHIGPAFIVDDEGDYDDDDGNNDNRDGGCIKSGDFLTLTWIR